jgi:hypothetical protein
VTVAADASAPEGAEQLQQLISSGSGSSSSSSSSSCQQAEVVLMGARMEVGIESQPGEWRTQPFPAFATD